MDRLSSGSGFGAYSLSVSRFARFTAAAAFLLVIAGGLVTSTGSSLAVPDWPLSFGQVFPAMEGGVLFEHGHRMIAATVGLLTMILMIVLLRKESRRWVKWLGVAAFLAVVVQGLLGGITVLMRLPVPVSVGHAALGQIFFTLIMVLALATSRDWMESPPATRGDEGTPGLRVLAASTTGAFVLQLILGAVVRHTGSGLAIPDFPLSFGRLVPADPAGQVLIAYLHRLGAVLVTLLVLWLGARILRRHAAEPRLVLMALALLGLVLTQIALGGMTVISLLAVVPATAHQATGALLLALSTLLSLRVFRYVGRKAPVQSESSAKAALSAGMRA